MQQKERNDFEEKHHMHLIESLKKRNNFPLPFRSVTTPDRVTNHFNQHSVKRCRITSMSCFFETPSCGQTIWQISIENIQINDFLGDFSIVINLIKDA